MAPERNHYHKQSRPNANGNVNAKAGPSKPSGQRQVPPTAQRDPSGIPGLNKLKAAIRQTTRLLARENLEPGLRLATERRLASQQADLKNAERREKEKKNGAKYHLVKFFEQKKLQRIIKRLHKSLSTAPANTRSQLETDLYEARVMLAYVRHYPNTQKYIALFPSSDSSSSDQQPQPQTDNLTLPKLFAQKPDPADKTATRRRELLDKFSAAISAGTIRADVENETEKEREGLKKMSIALDGSSGDGSQVKGEGKGHGGKGIPGQSKSKKTVGEEKKEEVEEDDFFQAGSDEE